MNETFTPETLHTQMMTTTVTAAKYDNPDEFFRLKLLQLEG